MSASSSPSPESSQAARAIRCNAAVLVVAAIGVAGSLMLTWGLDLKACPLCLYQRTFVMGAMAVLAIGMLTKLRDSVLPMVLALPAAVGGLGVAAFHEYLELAGRLECPPGLLGLGSAPQQSLAMFVLLLGVAGASLLRHRKQAEVGATAVAAAVAVGLLLSLAAVKTAPPPCKPDYTKPLDGCRPTKPATEKPAI